MRSTSARLGRPIRAFADLRGLALKVDGEPAIVGPYTPMDTAVVPTIRTLGYRRLGSFPPIVHAKLALLGHLWWHDEGPLGHVEDVIGFTPCRLWISSANFTRSSRRNLEFGYWTEDRALVQGAERFLVRLMRSSEALDPEADAFDPDLAPVDFDDVAMAEAWAELRWDEDERGECVGLRVEDVVHSRQRRPGAATCARQSAPINERPPRERTAMPPSITGIRCARAIRLSAARGQGLSTHEKMTSQSRAARNPTSTTRWRWCWAKAAARAPDPSTARPAAPWTDTSASANCTSTPTASGSGSARKAA